VDVTRQIPESEWKVFRRLRAVALERFCDRVLEEAGRLAADGSRGSHERYLEPYRLIQKRDEELGDCFNDPRRSTASFQLARIHGERLLTEEELHQLSPETRAVMEFLARGWER
jgi:hypothetical protein